MFKPVWFVSFAMELQDKIDVVRCYFSASCNATAALRMFKKERNLHNGPFDTRTIQLQYRDNFRRYSLAYSTLR